MRNTWSSWVVGCALMVAVFSVGANQANLDASAIREQQKQIRADAEAGKGRYAKLSPKQRQELFHQQERVGQLLDANVQNTTELPESDQVALFNALESIEAIVNNAEKERMICERHKPVGTNRPRTVCRTAAQRAAERDASQERVIERTQTCFKGSTDPNGGCG